MVIFFIFHFTSKSVKKRKSYFYTIHRVSVHKGHVCALSPKNAISDAMNTGSNSLHELKLANN